MQVRIGRTVLRCVEKNPHPSEADRRATSFESRAQAPNFCGCREEARKKMNSKPDPLKKTTLIPFRFTKGKFVHLDDGTEINELTENCVGDIIVETWKITNQDR